MFSPAILSDDDHNESAKSTPTLVPPAHDERNYEDILIGAVNEMIRDFLTRMEQDYSYSEEFQWTLNLRHNIDYSILLKINRS